MYESFGLQAYVPKQRQEQKKYKRYKDLQNACHSLTSLADGIA